MTRRRLFLLAGAILAASFATPEPASRGRAGAATLPVRLTDRQFWEMVTEFSEPDGYFRSDNLLSNEINFQRVIPDLVRDSRRDRVYIGVGPEQNFTYISSIRPRMAFIVDVRRANLRLHLMYKALFELSADRAEFVSRLFAKPRPRGLGPRSTAQEIFAAYAKVDTSDDMFKATSQQIVNHLLLTRRLRLTKEDVQGIEHVYYQFYWYGPIIRYWSTSGGGRGARYAPSYVDLMIADDGQGQPRSYLSSEDRFTFVKHLHERNLVIPVVGNFAGPKALRSIARYLESNRAVVAAFYLSNVEQYLSRAGLWEAFCGNAARLPLDPSSAFIRTVRNGMYGPGVNLDSVLGNISMEVRACPAR